MTALEELRAFLHDRADVSDNDEGTLADRPNEWMQAEQLLDRAEAAVSADARVLRAEGLVIEQSRALTEASRALAEAVQDKVRMDWLEKHHVEVYEALRYGTRELFMCAPTQHDAEADHDSTLRDSIDSEILEPTK